MLRVGLTGGIACGKSTVAGLLRARGVPVIDADQVAREVVAPGQPALAEIAARFGSEILQPDGSLNRKALGARVVADPAAKADLERMLHGRIRALLAQWLAAQAQAGAPVAVVEAALLVETGSYQQYDALLVVRASPDVQRARLMAREGLDAATADQWLAAQLPLAAKVAVATAVVDNDGEPAALEGSLDLAWATILQGKG